MLSPRVIRPVAIGAAVVVIGGGAYGIASSASSSGTTGTTTAQTAAQTAPARSNARSGPAAGGTVGTVAGVSGSTLTVSTSAGEKVTVHTSSSTKYRKGTASSSASAVKAGEPVLVLGTTSGTSITATQVTVQPRGYATSSSKVVPFKRGAPSTSKQVGQVPSNYTEGSGTIVGGTTANRATEAALAAYPGGVVDRVVKLSNGEYEVHTIGVNWPHHVFVTKSFKVAGAD